MTVNQIPEYLTNDLTQPADTIAVYHPAGLPGIISGDFLHAF